MSEPEDEPSTSRPRAPSIKRHDTAPSGILRSPSESSGLLSPDASQSPGFPHSNSYPNIKFAPLPELAPRKRHSSVSLGVASRSSLLRASRSRAGVVYAFPGEGGEQPAAAEDGNMPASSPVAPEPSSPVVHRQSSRKRKESKDGMTSSRDRKDSNTGREDSKREEDIAMDELTKLVKGAGKKLFSWKKGGGSKSKGQPEMLDNQTRPESTATILADVLADEPPSHHTDEVKAPPVKGNGLTVMEFLGTAEGAVLLDSAPQDKPYMVSDPSELPDFPGLSTSATPIIAIEHSSSSSDTNSQEGSGYGEVGERRRSRTSSQADVVT